MFIVTLQTPSYIIYIIPPILMIIELLYGLATRYNTLHFILAVAPRDNIQADMATLLTKGHPDPLIVILDVKIYGK